MKLPKGWGQLPPGRRKGIERLELKLRQETYAVQSFDSAISVLKEDAAEHKLAIQELLAKRNYHRGRVISLKNQIEAYKQLKREGR